MKSYSCLAHHVQRRDTLTATTGDVQHTEVERKAEQLVAQHIDDELVDLHAPLAGATLEDRAGRFGRVDRRSVPCR